MLGDQGLGSGYLALIDGNTIVGFDDAISIDNGCTASNTRGHVSFTNNLIYNCTNGIILNDSPVAISKILASNNAMGLVTNRLTATGDLEEINPVLLTADPFTDSANNDYSLNNVAGGGALCRSAGLEPGALL